VTHDRRTGIRQEVQKWFDDPVFFGFDFIPELRSAQDKPYIFIDHAYFDRGYRAGNFRVIRSNVHQVSLKTGRTDRPKTYTPRFDPKRKGKTILVFPPSETMQQTFDAQNWTDETVAEIRKYSDRPIIIKRKHTELPLEHYLRSAHCVVGFGTVAVVKALMAGIPAVAGPRCPATPVACPMEKIESPEIGDREAWFNSLTWSQFHISEIQNGLCREVMNGA
jgi:hypothetical protein